VGLVATWASLYTAVALFACVTGGAALAAIGWHLAVLRRAEGRMSTRPPTPG
jgi:hypothetical protein